MAHPTTVTDENFGAEVLNADKPVLVDFYADWCGPCKIIAPVVEEIAAEFEGRAKVAKLDIDANPRVAGTYGIRSIPTLIIFDRGKPVAQTVGVASKAALKQGLEEVLGLAKAA